MRILVTGGAGFLGSTLALRLATDGHDVFIVDSFATSGGNNIADLRAARNIDVQQADVTTDLPDPGGLDAVLHLACAASPDDYQRLPLETLATGADGTRRALDLAAESGARFLFASSSEIYGEPLRHPQREFDGGLVDPVGPRSAYDEAKRFGEALTTAYRRTHGVNTAIARIFNTYGPRMRPYDGRVVPTFVRQALADEPLTVHGNGRQTRSFCYVDDLVEALVRLIGSDLAGPVNLGNPQELTMLELAEQVIAVAGSASSIALVPGRPADPTIRCPDISLATAELGWTPQFDLVAGLTRMVEGSRSS
jgi:dTDP-glucose 4,6-dehydratase